MIKKDRHILSEYSLQLDAQDDQKKERIVTTLMIVDR